jgi:superfamily I DNA/RNA helicase
MPDELTAAKRQTRIESELVKLAHLFRQRRNDFLRELASSLVDETGILRLLETREPKYNDRMYNVQELLSGISEYTDKTENPTLEGFVGGALLRISISATTRKCRH